MTKNELYLKTVFCCMACDGDIAEEEIDMVRHFSSENAIFEGLDVEKPINLWIVEINEKGGMFLRTYLSEVAEFDLSVQDQLTIVDLAIKVIEADNQIKYSEVKFFKKIRTRLSISDEDILRQHPDKEDFLLPDINVAEDPIWNSDTQFSQISLATMKDLQKPS